MRPARFAIPLAVLLLCACQQAEDEAAQPNPDAKPGLTVSDADLVLPAVKGNPGAAYFTLANKGEKVVELASVFIDGAARAEMHETRGGAMDSLAKLPVRKGEVVKFERGGKHVMLFDLDAKLQPGAKTEMTLTFTDGDKLSAPIEVKSAGDAGGGN